MANQTRQTVVTGNILQLVIGNKVVGLGQTADGRRSFGTEPVHGIGNFMPVEHVQLRYDGTFTCDRFFIRVEDLRSLGLAALGSDVLDLGIIDILVVDKVSRKIVRQYIGCTISDYTETFRANAIAGENATWRYLDCKPASGAPVGGDPANV
jgi:hypothetical protein